MSPLRRFKPFALVALLAAVLLGGHAWNLASAEPALVVQDHCWTIKTTICTDCAESDSKYCDPRIAEGPYVSCIQSLTKPCDGFTCSAIDAKTGPPCN
jgi:hypothetical protein